MLIKPKRIYTYCNKIYLTYKAEYVEYHNIHNNQPWHGWEESAIFIGFDNRLFDYEKSYYDGHTSIHLTILGIIVGQLSTHEYEPKDE